MKDLKFFLLIVIAGICADSITAGKISPWWGIFLAIIIFREAINAAWEEVYGNDRKEIFSCSADSAAGVGRG